MSTCLDCSRYIGCLHESKSVSFRCPNFSSLADAEQGTLSSLLAKVLVAENSTASRAERNRHRRANEVITLEPMSSAAEAEKRADFEIARIMSSVAEAERVDAAVLVARERVHRHRIGVVEEERSGLGDLADIAAEIEQCGYRARGSSPPAVRPI